PAKTAPDRACAPSTVDTCTTHGPGTGGSATGSFLLKEPLASVVTALPSELAQELVPPITPRDGVDCPQISIISRACERQPLPLTVIEPPVPAWDLERLTLSPSAATAVPARGSRSSA